MESRSIRVRSVVMPKLSRARSSCRLGAWPQPDPEKLKTYLGLIFGSLGGAMTSAMISLGDRLGLYRVLAERGALTSARAGGGDRAEGALAARVAVPAGRGGRARAPRRGALRALGRGRGRARRREPSPRSARASSPTCRRRWACVERLPEAFRTRRRPALRRVRPRGRGRHRARLRAVVPHHARAPRAAAPAGRGRRAAARRHRRGRRLRLRRRGARAREGVPALDLPRLRHLRARARARARTNQRARGRHERALPRRDARVTPGRRAASTS